MRKLKANLTLISLFVATICSTQAKPYAVLEKDTLKIGNDKIERTFKFNDGDLVSKTIANKKSNQTFNLHEKVTDILIPKEKAKPSNGYFKTREVPDDEIRKGWLECEVGFQKGNVFVKRIFKIFEDSPAIAVEVFFKGQPAAKTWAGTTQSFADKKNIESQDIAKDKNNILCLDTFDLKGSHWKLYSVEFFDATDHNNTLTVERSSTSYRRNALRGNLLFAVDMMNDNGVFWLKESPCSSVQLSYPNADFFADFGRLNLVGAGVNVNDLKNDDWVQAYGYVFGVFKGGEYERLSALREYQKNLRSIEQKRDVMVMLNTWGDRGQDKKVTEAFCINEANIASKIGVTHFQIDDGWQEGKSANSAFGGSFKNIWSNPDYWKPSKTKYPNGLKPVVEAAKKAGVELCLWFNPSAQNNYEDWQKDISAMNYMYDNYGIRTFKIDGLHIPNKISESRIRSIFDAVLEHTKNKAVFNLDATAGRRGGYFMYNKYGNIFLENRYTDWQNYYPFWTLRNLWMISKYVPAERLQIEFLNNLRNKEKYAKNDIFAPSKYDMKYLFATTMAAQPLAWMEASGLSESQVEELAPLVKAYNKISHSFHSGKILPIAEEPSGRSWTGFQSEISKDAGYFLVYRELNDEHTYSVKVWLKSGVKVKCIPVLGDAKEFSATVNKYGFIEFSLPTKNSFGLWKYEIVK